MARTRRLIGQITAAAVALLLLAGCGSAVGPDVAGDELPGGETVQAATGAAPPEPATEPVPGEAGTAADDGRSAAPAPPAPAQLAPPPRPREPERPVANQAHVQIPRIGVDAPLIALGLNSDRTMEVPTRRGWRAGTSTARRPVLWGPAIIAGHVTLRGAPDVFYRLVDLEPGDRASVR
jgi:hypothetical protein